MGADLSTDFFPEKTDDDKNCMKDKVKPNPFIKPPLRKELSESISMTSAMLGRYLARMPSLRRLPTKQNVAVQQEPTYRFDTDERYDNLRFVDFNDLKMAGKFPEYGDEGWRIADRPCSKFLNARASEMDFETSLVIFVSHCWNHESLTPDTANNDQYKLCIEAVEYIKEHWAPGMTKCYLWIDYTCLNLNDTATTPMRMSEVKSPPLDLIMGCCDCMLTPLYDSNENWQPTSQIKNFFEDCDALPWRGNDHSYLNRAWCRIEMLYCSSVPILKDINKENSRRKHFAGVMNDFINRYQRPHILYANYLQKHKNPPIILSLSRDTIQKYHPSSGRLTNGHDKSIITKLMKDLHPYLNDSNKIGYTGEVNAEGKMHGDGVFKYENGDEYTGQWQNGLYHGKGIKKYLELNKTVECEYENGIEIGLCTVSYNNNDKYYGTLCQGKRVGKGIMEYHNNDTYDGNFKDDLKDGNGVYNYFESGEIYEGQFKNDMRHGKGTLRSADGNVIYKGMWRNDERKQRRNSV